MAFDQLLGKGQGAIRLCGYVREYETEEGLLGGAERQL